jgi:hypothetical protein
MASQHSTGDYIDVDTGSLPWPESPINDSMIDPALLPSTSTSAIPIPSPTPSRASSRAPSQPQDQFDTPDTATQGSTKRIQLKWTSEMQDALLNTLLDQCRAGKRADSGFKKEAWVTVLAAVQATTTSSVNEKQVKSRIDWLKCLWKEWLSLQDNSGFGWDDTTELFTAEDSVWKEYLKVSNIRASRVFY